MRGVVAPAAGRVFVRRATEPRIATIGPGEGEHGGVIARSDLDPHAGGRTWPPPLRSACDMDRVAGYGGRFSMN